MIKLTENLCITADSNCYILGVPYTNKKGELVIQRPSYYGNMGMALNAAVDRIVRSKVSDGSITTLRGFVDEYTKASNEFKQFLKEEVKQDAE